MSDNWYYVQKGNRNGPVAMSVIESMFKRSELTSEDYVWKKGFENWKKIKDVSELQFAPPTPTMQLPPELIESEASFKNLDLNERAIFVRIGADRNSQSTDYGPFSLLQLKQLFKENRINGKTFVFFSGLKSWVILADFKDYNEVFEELPPQIKEVDRRTNQRKPFIARMFFQNNKKIFEGICRDISIGGMQVLTDNFKGQAGDKININVHPDNSEYHFTAAGVVVRLLEGNSGFSFRFNQLNEEAKHAIEKYIQEN